MAKNRKVKGFCGFCGDPVITGGKEYGTKWYHNPCYVAHSYGMPQDIKRGEKPRRSAPPRREIRERSEEDLNPVEVHAGGIQPELEVLAHANNVTLGMNPMRKGAPQMYYIWQGPRASAQSIVRFPTYNQANQYYRDVIDGKSGTKNPGSRFRMRPIFWIAGVVGVVALAYWIYKRRSTIQGKVKQVAGIAAKMAAAPRPPDGFGGSP
jgi:hypothetical protein